MPETESKREATNSLPGNIIVCPDCAASRVAKSRLRKMDKFRIRFFPMRPYRCLHCYHRFWAKESFTAEKNRVWSWVVLLIVLFCLLLLLYGRAPQQNSGGDRQRNGDAQQAELDMNSQRSEPESVITPVTEQPTAAPEELAAVSERLKEFGWYVNDPDDEQQQIETAKNLSEAAVDANKSSPESNQSIPEVTVEERESLIKVTIARHMKQWRIAWESGDIDAYLANYSDSFVPTNWQTFEQWRAVRIERVNPKKQIQLELSKFDVSFSDDYQKVTIEFNQRYQSKNYLDNSRKRIVWVQEGDTWKIASEREIE